MNKFLSQALKKAVSEYRKNPNSIKESKEKRPDLIFFKQRNRIISK